MSLQVNIKGNPITLLDSKQLAIFHQKSNKLDGWILDTFFPNRSGLPLMDTENNKKVYIGSLETSSPIAPLVAPTVEGRIITEKAVYEADYVEPPYLKPSSYLRPANVHDLALLHQLESMGVVSNIHEMTMVDKLRLAQVHSYMKRQESIHNFKVLMARDILFTGKTTFKSQDFPEYTVDYKRHADMDYTPAVPWDDDNATPVSDINNMIEIMLDHDGTSPVIALTSSKIINRLKHNAEFKKEFVEVNGANAVNPIQTGFINDKPTYHGSIGNIQFWSWDKTFKNAKGEVERYVKQGSFRLIADTQGHQVACGLVHFDVLNQPLESYDYMVEDKDPSGYKMITDSSPLIVPSMRNGVIGGDNFLS